ncbi:phosphatidylinositol alpha 1,6-mannosyltransferase [Allocatelliglobosispora scoriae]|uniref:Phosphatidylinositol alpha 1,6-mannosyltransferase n=1 Tax=Allocatelliglobosispora scoriae TaxID=643052 RepID=A0A841BLU0_9ACTN|nr:glycosyltransferase family 1 protein [Allocatelliglobosispora scoriae]MBB5867943.1 phosphatidylinositol alpha 1,6-mannosyltransferase [Allocatelliglobosispora scoriae]
MRVAIITESFAPDVNGVANSVARVTEHLVDHGHEPMVIAPRPMRLAQAGPSPFPVVRLPSLPLPGYASVRLTPPSRRIEDALRDFQPDVVHLASPFVLGRWGARAASRLGLPIVAVYQTDVPGYARAYRAAPAEAMAWRWISRLHAQATITLAPSSATAAQLTEHGVGQVHRWGRGVDTARFHPRHRSADLRASLAPPGHLIVGYVGRLAREKQVELLAGAAALPGVTVVVIGDGPMRRAVRRAMPEAVLLGTRHGAELSRLYASFDVFAHTGPHETFCQTIQEALASGVPVVAPGAGGPIDLIAQERTGLLVAPGDPAAMTAAVARLLHDPGLRERLGGAARASVVDRTWSALGDELIEYYRQAVHAPGAVPVVVPSAIPARLRVTA